MFNAVKYSEQSRVTQVDCKGFTFSNIHASKTKINLF